MKKFAPTVNLDGFTVTPRGWQRILAFAMAGCGWAIKIVETKKFQEEMRADLARIQEEKKASMIKWHEQQIERIKNGAVYFR